MAIIRIGTASQPFCNRSSPFFDPVVHRPYHGHRLVAWSTELTVRQPIDNAIGGLTVPRYDTFRS
jgi:hypothetical protein